MEKFNYKNYCIGLTIGIKFPPKYSIEDKLGELSDYFIEKCSFKKRQKIETPYDTDLRLYKDLMEIVIDCENFVGSYSYFYGDSIRTNLFPDSTENDSGIKLYGKPAVYSKSYEQTINDFKKVFSFLFRSFRKSVGVDKIERVGMVHYFMIFYDHIKFRYTESLEKGADLSFGENHNKLARNQYSYDQTDSHWKNAVIEYTIDKKRQLANPSKPFGKLYLDIQTYYKPQPFLIDKLGGEEKIVEDLFKQTYEFIDKSKLFDSEKESTK